MNSRRSFFKTAFKTAGAGVAAMVLPATVLAQTERVGDEYSKYGMSETEWNASVSQSNTSADPANLNKVRDILNNNSFKPGWGFDLKDADGECPGVSVTVYTPQGTNKWGKAVVIPNDLIEDDTFDVVKYFSYHVDRFAGQLARIQQGLPALA
jgi:hypothetical protein